ncbi:Abhydrolase domain-containing protein [Ceratobasidium sp. AG-Ba]|nr:Abhydrolase domain-containing protein [Ceratobasidium sp. AG-Ba]
MNSGAFADFWPLPADFDRSAPLEEGINWLPCKVDFPGECGRFEVPMDYKNSSAGKASLAVVRIKSRSSKKMGTLFTNPGGPSQAGTWNLLLFTAEQMLEAAGGLYDIVSWDPRGVGETFPRANCLASRTDQRILLGGSMILDDPEMRAGLPLTPEELKQFLREIHEYNCCSSCAMIPGYVGTAATVRDMIKLHDYLDGPEVSIKYWRFSYGTVIGRITGLGILLVDLDKSLPQIEVQGTPAALSSNHPTTLELGDDDSDEENEPADYAQVAIECSDAQDPYPTDTNKQVLEEILKLRYEVDPVRSAVELEILLSPLAGSSG